MAVDGDGTHSDTEDRAQPQSRAPAIITVLLIFLAIFGGNLVFAGAAGAHFSAGYYTFKNGGPCTEGNRVDPRNLVFYRSATGTRSLNHIQAHTGWSSQGGTTQYFQSHGYCREMTGQRGSAPLLALARWHVRVRTTYHSDSTYRTTAQAGAHRDNTDLCGHFVPSSGFNTARNEVRNQMVPSAHHTHGRTVNSQNNAPMRQCNGLYAASDGYVYWITVPSSSH